LAQAHGGRMRYFLRPRAMLTRVNEHELAIAISEYEWRDNVVFYRIDVERASVEWHVWRRFSELRDLHLELGDDGSFPTRFLLNRSYYNLTVRMLKLEQWLRKVAVQASHAGKVETWLRPALTFASLPEPVSPAKSCDERRCSKESSTTASSDCSSPCSPASSGEFPRELSAFQLRRAEMRRAKAAAKAAQEMTKEEAENLCRLQVQAAEYNERHGEVLEPEPVSPLSPTMREIRYKSSFGEDLH